MRNEMQEPGRGMFAASPRTTATSARALEASVVDAALDDESTPILAERGSRREFPSRGADASRVAIDNSHAAAVSDGALIRQLSRQLALLETQQRQIRQLLEMTEQRFGGPGAARAER
jgi:hypothetical protein